MSSHEAPVGPSRTEGDTIMRVRDASVAFQMDRGESRVLNDVDVDIRREEVLGVIGESGSGKSMFASSLLNAVVEPGVTTGEITYYPSGGEPVDVLGLDDDELRAFRWEEVAMVFQGAMSSFNPVMTIGAHFRETVDQHDYDMTEGMERARQLISDLYMDPDRVLDSYPHELSGGMQQRAIIALALLLEPSVVIADEPTTALDVIMQDQVFQELEDMKEDFETSMLLITHDISLVFESCDRMAVMHGGQIAETGAVTSIYDEPRHPYSILLQGAFPDIKDPDRELETIDGAPPQLYGEVTECSFVDRCPWAIDECSSKAPHLDPIEGSDDDSHRAACFRKHEVLDMYRAENDSLGARSATDGGDPS